MEKIALCGDDCPKCPRFLAKTEKELADTAELWYRVGWRDRVVPPKEIQCTGCSPRKECTYQLVECVKEHDVEKCSQCAEFPCVKIEQMLKRSVEVQRSCKELCSEKEYAMLERAFFNKEENLRR